MSSINIIIDESGTMCNNSKQYWTWTNYFVIAGYIVDDKGLKILESKHLKAELEIKNANSQHYKKIEEIKGTNIIASDSAKLLFPFQLLFVKNT